jgi:syringate O-demethylase
MAKGDPGKWIEFPHAVYAMHPYDLVKAHGKPAGISTWVGYSYNERKMLTLAILDPEHAESGAQVSLVWGEAGGGTGKLTVERHVQMEIGATVSPVPYAEVARKVYADGGWRAAAA